MKKVKLFTSLYAGAALAVPCTILSSCSTYWDNRFLDLTTSEKELSTTLPNTSCVYSFTLKDDLEQGQYIVPEIKLKATSDSGIKIKADEKAKKTNKLIYFTVTMENIPETGKDQYWATFTIFLNCKKADDTLAWGSNNLDGFKLTINKAA